MIGPVVEYRPIPGRPGYWVGSDGSVWSCRTHNGDRSRWRRRAVQPSIGGGYLYLWIDGRHLYARVADLMAAAFPPSARRAGPGSRGESHGRSRMTAEGVSEARWLRACDPGRWTYEALAARYGVHRQTIYHAISGRTWSHLRPDGVDADADGRADAEGPGSGRR